MQCNWKALDESYCSEDAEVEACTAVLLGDRYLSWAIRVCSEPLFVEELLKGEVVVDKP